MASVRDTVHYPSLYQNRSDCFIHLFLTGGNGYFWLNGELIDMHEETELPTEPNTVDRSIGDIDLQKVFKSYNDLEDARYRFTFETALSNIDGYMDEPISFAGKIHPFMSEIVGVPIDEPNDEMKDDWRWALNQTTREIIRVSRLPDSTVSESLVANAREIRAKYFAVNDDFMRDNIHKVIDALNGK